MVTDLPHLSITLVEDHDSLRMLLAQALEEAGHQVLALSCAEELGDEAGGQNADVFLVDLNLPGEDGLSLLQRLRAAHPLAGLVVISARSALEARLQSYEAGADLYLTKPLEVRELCAAVASFARRRQHLAHTTAADGLQLALQQLALSHRGGEPVHLTPAEAALLAAFARAPGQRLAYWQLAETLGMDLQNFSKPTLEVRMVRLRKKLVDAGAPAVCIEAVRGHGYQLCTPLQLF